MGDDRLQRCPCGSPLSPPADGLRFRCPACRRIHDLDSNVRGTSEVAVPEAWETEPREGPFTEVAVGWTFSKEDLERISWGAVPRGQEDKWFIVREDDQILFYRSWSGTLCYVAHLSGHEIALIEIAGQLNSPMNKPEMVRWLIDRFLLGKDVSFPG